MCVYIYIYTYRERDIYNIHTHIYIYIYTHIIEGCRGLMVGDLGCFEGSGMI